MCTVVNEDDEFDHIFNGTDKLLDGMISNPGTTATSTVWFPTSGRQVVLVTLREAMGYWRQDWACV